MDEGADFRPSRFSLGEIGLLLVTTLLPYGLEVDNGVIFHMFFGRIYLPEYDLVLYFQTVFNWIFHPLAVFEILVQLLYEWSVIVVVPLVLNILLLVLIYRYYKLKGSIHSIRYLVVAAIAYAFGLSTMSGILPIPLTPSVYLLLEMYHRYSGR